VVAPFAVDREIARTDTIKADMAKTTPTFFKPFAIPFFPIFCI
jgi:hypothetical protein